MNDRTAFEQIEPELLERITARPESLGKAASVLAGVASIPLALGVLSQAVFGEGLPDQIVDVLNFALTLEHIEDDFYRAAMSHSGLIPDSDKKVFETISKHESAHVKVLMGVLGSKAAAAPNVDVRGRFLKLSNISCSFGDV